MDDQEQNLSSLSNLFNWYELYLAQILTLKFA